jgi:hypothetical protein
LAVRARRHLVEQALADRAVDHLVHVSDVAKQERQVEDVDVVDDWPQRADAAADHLDRAELGLLDRLRLAAQLHRGVHLNGEPTLRRIIELLAEIFDGLDGWVAFRMHIGGLQHGLVGGQRMPPARHDAQCRRPDAGQQIPSSHVPLPANPRSLAARIGPRASAC